MPTKRMLVGMAMVTMAVACTARAEGKVRLMILSGQSNMAGFNHTTTFLPAMKEAFPGDEIIAVKSAQGGQPIRRWYKQWKPVEGQTVGAFQPGDLYDKLMEAVKPAIAGKQIDSVTFFWMQGESDANAACAGVYKTSMSGLIKQLRDDLQRQDMAVVIGRINDIRNGKAEWDAVRQAQEEVAAEDPLVKWVSTDDLNNKPDKEGKLRDDMHYTREGYDEFGTRLAAEAVKLLKK